MEQWLQEACRLIRYDSDRASVEWELRSHMDDVYDSFLRNGSTEEESIEKTLSVMGDAQVVAKEMEKIYRPYWAYLAKYTRILSIIAGIFLAINLVSSFWSMVIPDYQPNKQFTRWREVSTILSDYTPDTVATCSGYTISVARAQFVEYDLGRRCNFILKIQHPNPWISAPYFYHNLSATDDCGTIYESRQNWNVGPDIPTVTGNLAYTDKFVTYYDMWIDAIDPKATTITLTFDKYGEYWEIPMMIEEVAYEEVSE